MRPIFPLLLAAAFLVGGSRPLRAQASDTAAVLATVQRLMDTLAERDTATARTLLAPGFRLAAMRADTASRLGSLDEAGFLGMMTHGSERVLERIWAPAVQIHGPIATVWTPYDFHEDGQFSHCGIDAFTLLRVGTEWRIASLVYTVQRRGCAPSPLGPPPAR